MRRLAWLATALLLSATGCAQGDLVDEPGTVASGDDVGSIDDSSVTPPVEEGGVVTPPVDEDTGSVATDTGSTSLDTGGGVLDTAPPAPTYPPGPYGKTLGATVPNLAWKGYRDGTGAWTDIKLGDYYDPDGKLGVRAIKVGMAALW